MVNNFNSGFNPFPLNRFDRNNTKSPVNKDATNSKSYYSSLDGRSFQTRDQAIRANHDFYRRMMNNSFGNK